MFRWKRPLNLLAGVTSPGALVGLPSALGAGS